MQFIDLLPREHVIVPLEAGTLAEASATLVRALGAAGALDEPAAVEQWLLERRPGEVGSATNLRRRTCRAVSASADGSRGEPKVDPSGIAAGDSSEAAAGDSPPAAGWA